MKILSCKDYQEVADLLKQLNGTENIYVNWTQNDVYIEIGDREIKLSPNGDGGLDLDPYTEGVEGLYYKCPKCGQHAVIQKYDSNEMGQFEWEECEKCDYHKLVDSSPPQWFIEESRPESGPGSRAPYGMGIRDEYGGL